METLADLVAQFRGGEAGGFDVTEPQALLLGNEAIKRLAAESEWIRAELELGPTVAEQAVYPLSSRIVKLLVVTLGGYPYTRVDPLTLNDLKTGLQRLVNGGAYGGVFAERFTADGLTKEVEFYLAPSEAGGTITGLAAITPEDLEPADPLPFPVQSRRAVLDYMKSIAYEEIDENPQSGTYYRERADAEAEKLRRLANSRTGSGPTKARVAGHRR